MTVQTGVCLLWYGFVWWAFYDLLAEQWGHRGAAWLASMWWPLAMPVYGLVCFLAWLEGVCSAH